MARDRPPRPDLAARIAELANRLGDEVVEVLRGAALEDLIALARDDQAGPPAGPRPTGPPRSERAAATAPEAVAAPPPRRRWPRCSEPGCDAAYYPASGTAHHCYQHFIASGGQHPSRRPAPPPLAPGEGGSS